MPKLIFIFLDGVGIGKAAGTNPFYAAKTDWLPFFESGCMLPDQTPVKAIDAQLGVEGMPMSATGQTSLFTGVNVPVLLQEHRDSYPDPLMRKIIKEKSIFTELRKHHFKPRFLNVFPGSYHLYTPENIYIRSDGEFYFSPVFRARVRRSLSATTCMMIANHMRPFGENDILNERALFHDFSNRSLNGSFPHLPTFSPEKAAEIMFNASRPYDLILYEYFQTDLYGHGFDYSDCLDLVRQLNRLVKHLVSLLDREKDTLLITSDHGNLEDNTTQLHTYNPVPLLTWGYRSNELRSRIENLAEVKPAIVDFFNSPG
jgi:2,3-bisphosphoglycerate-independent phosphoglycerate mutase